VVDLARRTADDVFIPFTIGGGIRSVADAQGVLDAGADKVSINSAALARPELIDELAANFGAQCVVLAIDAKRGADSWEAYVAGGRTPTGRDAVAWARGRRGRRAVRLDLPLRTAHGRGGQGAAGPGRGAGPVSGLRVAFGDIHGAFYARHPCRAGPRKLPAGHGGPAEPAPDRMEADVRRGV